eukprot:2882302-Amphidinium_carterae.1
MQELGHGAHQHTKFFLYLLETLKAGNPAMAEATNARPRLRGTPMIFMHIFAMMHNSLTFAASAAAYLTARKLVLLSLCCAHSNGIRQRRARAETWGPPRYEDQVTIARYMTLSSRSTHREKRKSPPAFH